MAGTFAAAGQSCAAAIDDRIPSIIDKAAHLNEPVKVTNSDVEQILSLRKGQLAEISERSARSPTMSALNRCRGRCIFRTIEHNAQRVTIDADNSKFRSWDGRTLKL
jgi:hypothetical protein